MNSRFFLFDVDGTLTPPRGKADTSFTMQFVTWMSGKKVYLVSGSDMKKIKEQLPNSILSRCAGIFPSMANEFYDCSRDSYVYKNKWDVPAKLLNILNDFLLETNYDTKTGNHIEHRSGMLNFSIVGRNADKPERQRYFDWDKTNKERAAISSFIRSQFPDIDVSIGGQISIDINPRGNDKSQASQWIRENNKDAEIIFFGDKCYAGGNDYEICEDIRKNRDGLYWPVTEPQETIRVLLNNY